MPLTYHPYTPKDFVFCDTLIQQNMGAYFEASGQAWDSDYYRKKIEDGMAYIVWGGERKVGFFHLSIKDDAGYVNTIQLDPSFQGQGFGRQMLLHIDGLIKEMGYAFIRLKVFKDSPARRLYERLGYKVIAEEKDKFLMGKKL